YRYGTQSAHDAADSERVRDGLPETKALGDFEIGHGTRPVATDLDHVNRVAGSVESVALVGRRFDCRIDLQSLGDPVSHDFRGLQSHRVNVEKADRRVPQLRQRQNVAQQILSENGAPGPDKGNFAFWVFLGHRRLGLSRDWRAKLGDCRYLGQSPSLKPVSP